MLIDIRILLRAEHLSVFICRMKKASIRFLVAYCALFLTAALNLRAEVSPPILLWPNGAPGEKGDIPEEKDTSNPESRKTGGQYVTRLGNVTAPTITFYRPPADKDTGAAVVVFPGGGYNILAFDLEGSEVCEWLNSIGVTGVLLKYRVPRRAGLEKHTAPLQDAQRSLGLVRLRADAMGIDPKRIGILGFSAGGHLAAALSNNYGERSYLAIDQSDRVSCRPDFTILVYPAYLTVKSDGDKLSEELPVNSKTPPTFLVQTQDDGVRVESSLFYYLALKNAEVPSELHLYPTGGHGYGLRPSAHMVSHWPERAGEWMRASGFLGK